jgi:hypothetical protein
MISDAHSGIKAARKAVMPGVAKSTPINLFKNYITIQSIITQRQISLRALPFI